jgi:hypothetical protein
MDIKTAMSKPFSDVKTLVIGIILMIIPLINILTIPGFILRVASKTMSGDKTLPKFDNFGELVIDSLKAIVTLIIHFIVYTIIAVILAFIPFVGPVLSLIWMVVFAFIMVSGVMTLAKTKNIGEAINIPELFKKAKNANFIIAVIVAGVISMIILGIITAIITLVFGAAMLPTLMLGQTLDPMQMMNLAGTMVGVGLVGMIIMSIFGFILNVFSTTLIAESYK